MTPEEQAAADAAAAAALEDAPITFDDKQQAKVNQLIQDRLARQKTQLETSFNTTLEEKLNALRTELAPKKKTGEADADAQAAETQRVLNDLKQAKEALEQRYKQSEESSAQIKAENARILKRQAMTTAMGDQFVNNEAVMALTDNPALGITVELDAETGAYLVREKGAIKMNSSMEPMTLQEFYSDYAAKNPYLAAGDTRQGSNATATRSTSAAKPQVKSKADLKTPAAKRAYIEEFGMDAFSELPLK